MLLTLLMTLVAAGCTATGTPDGTRLLGATEQAQQPAAPARPAVALAAARLPHRLAVIFERTREPYSDGMTGLMSQYLMPGAAAWATVYIYDNGEASIPDGTDSGPLLRVFAENLQAARGNAAEGVAELADLPVPGGPKQRCAVGRVIRDGRGIANYACATGVANVILKVRVTAFLPPDNKVEQDALDKIVAALLTDATRVVAGGMPMSVGTAPGAKPTPRPKPRGGPTAGMLRL